MRVTDSNITPLPDTAQIEVEASEWIMRFQGDDVSPADFAAFDIWRKKNALHGEIYERMSGFWDGLDFVEKLKDYAESDAAIEPIRQDRVARSTSFLRRVIGGVIAASVLGFIAVSSYTYIGQDSSAYSGFYETAIGGQEVINLPDGSQIVLNTDSAAKIAYTKDARIINLVKGEAYFDVASNKKRPFSVETEKGVVTAVGTAFSVRVRDKQLDVIVAEGRVSLDGMMAVTDREDGSQVLAENGERFSAMEVSAGQSAVIGQGIEAISLIAPSALKRELDWRDGELSFNGETLAQVVAEISRYTDISIEIGDESLKQQRIVAYYKIGNVERMFEALNVMANIEVEQLDAGRVRLYRAS